MLPKEKKSPIPSITETTPAEITTFVLLDYIKQQEEKRQHATQCKQESDLMTQNLRFVTPDINIYPPPLPRLHQRLTRLQRPQLLKHRQRPQRHCTPHRQQSLRHPYRQRSLQNP